MQKQKQKYNIEFYGINRERTFKYIKISGIVIRKILDKKEARHQNFIVIESNGNTVYVAHNTVLSDRIDVKLGMKLDVFGEFIFTRKGGTIHRTHQGFIKHIGG